MLTVLLKSFFCGKYGFSQDKFHHDISVNLKAFDRFVNLTNVKWTNPICPETLDVLILRTTQSVCKIGLLYQPSICKVDYM